jgi:hypothetical protein
MRRIITALITFAFPLMLTAQPPFPDSEEIRQFMSSTTCVVLEDGNPVYNTYITNAVKEFWTVTPVEFIKTSDFDLRRNNPVYSFIILTETNFEKDKSGSSYNYINLLQGKNVEELGKMPEICAVPLSASGEDDLEYGYKLGAILSFVQNHARMISANPSLTGRRYLRFYNKNIPDVKSMKILVRKEDLSPAINTLEALRSAYKYSIDIVSEEVIMKAIRDKAENTLVLHKVGPGEDKGSGYCFKMLFGTDDSDMYYYNQHTIDRNNPDGLLPADLKRLERF